MAPVPIEPELRYTGAVLVALHVLSAIYFTQNVGASLYRSFKSLSPSQDVRLRLDRRKKLVPIFAGLALLSLGTACYAALAYASLSFRVWAAERGVVEKPQSVRWLADTPIYQDAFEIVAEKARRFWWGQQLDLSIVPWSVLVATEGTRRGISNLFAFQCLAHLVSLSFAQNLFFVALLLTPTPLPEGIQAPSRFARVRNAIFTPKPRDWVLSPRLLLLTVLASYGTILRLPYAAGTASFSRVLGASRAFTFAPLVLRSVAPISWGSVQSGRRANAAAFVNLFRFMAVTSVVLHGMATLRGLRYNLPQAHYHRHSRFLPWDIEERSRWERTTTAIGKLLGSTRDHPVVAAVGYDVLISGLSVGLWAAVRSLGAGDILTLAVPLYHNKHESVEGGPGSSEQLAHDEQNHDDTDDTASASVRRRAVRGSRSKEDDEGHREPSASSRRRGRVRKTGRDPEEEPGDDTYHPSPEEKSSVKGDNLPAQEVDLEAAGLAWGLMSVGGLPLGSAGVFGGECLA
ncbi:hypothetical protein M406DRAFT_344220 [Cryphonectria parasitica EP155]|uniref:Uncharacterized protein n=1 Tax=Cryphonectria parasitica (strain ATCC 38755 / EP155) TaxID=660469 RepID=A0A9P4YCG3_CRYP1|nr:uncharacterized protein M406DRAFT_344220 [Cryphonectria parasitica EP155]KAF3770516.1 hypothetical protein M406DRAFT_344220 [Cryphonectria parasitica EP155]